MTIVWTACGSSTQWWSRDLLGTLYILGDGRSPLALRLQFPHSSASRDNERYLGRAHEDHRRQLLEKYPRPSRLEAPPKLHSSRLQFWIKLSTAIGVGWGWSEGLSDMPSCASVN